MIREPARMAEIFVTGQAFVFLHCSLRSVIETPTNDVCTFTQRAS